MTANLAPTEFAVSIGAGPLIFPVTYLPKADIARIAPGCSSIICGSICCGGTAEFFSPTP
ncbi:MAG: hypothetical protein A3J40_11750 [Erythrobacter sp. RIFCSPHIGHO2_12_FULL_63_10]|nr:MAG: hypothetical protein A3J40_11750 [Erythrobacter sp. RIFCSPHIGHO2_12_FULL_63_10]